MQQSSCCVKLLVDVNKNPAICHYRWLLLRLVAFSTDFAEPLAIPSYMEADLPSASFPTVSPLDNQPPEESISILTSMGFPRHHTIRALKATVSDLFLFIVFVYTTPVSLMCSCLGVCQLYFNRLLIFYF